MSGWKAEVLVIRSKNRKFQINQWVARRPKYQSQDLKIEKNLHVNRMLNNIKEKALEENLN